MKYFTTNKFHMKISNSEFFPNYGRCFLCQIAAKIIYVNTYITIKVCQLSFMNLCKHFVNAHLYTLLHDNIILILCTNKLYDDLLCKQAVVCEFTDCFVSLPTTL